MSYRFGALARGDAASTVEHANGMYLLACVSGRLATPALESVKSAFFRLAQADASAAIAVCAAAPSMIADAAGVVLVAGDHAYVACTGGALVLRERGAATARIEGSHALHAGDAWIVSATPLAIAGRVFAPAAARVHAGAFRNDELDAELAAVAQLAPPGAMAIAALRVV